MIHSVYEYGINLGINLGIETWSRFCSHVKNDYIRENVHDEGKFKYTVWPRVRPSTILVTVLP